MEATSVLLWSDATLSEKVLLLAVALCLVMGLVIVLGALRRKRVLRIGAVKPASLAQDERTALLEAIKDAATEPNMIIGLGGFWRGRGWNRAQRYVLLRPLMERQILRLPPTNDRAEEFVRDLAYRVLCVPPGRVVLNTRDWTRMATDGTGQAPRIIVQGVYGGINQIGGTGNHQIVGNRQGTSEAGLRHVIEALRTDAGSAPPDVAAQAEEAARGLEDGLASGRRRTVSDWIQRATDLVGNAAGAMDATRKALDALP